MMRDIYKIIAFLVRNMDKTLYSRVKQITHFLMVGNKYRFHVINIFLNYISQYTF